MSEGLLNQKEYKVFQTVIDKKFESHVWDKQTKMKESLKDLWIVLQFDEVWETFTNNIDLDEDRKKDIEKDISLEFYEYLSNCIDIYKTTKNEKDIKLPSIGARHYEDIEYKDNYQGDDKWLITPEEIHQKTALTEGDISTYYELLDNTVFKKRNWDKVFTEKEVEEKYEYSKDMYTTMEWRVSQKDNFEKQLRLQYNSYLEEHASIYQLKSQYKRQCSYVNSWSNPQKDVYVEVIEDFRYMEFCMIIGYEFPKNSIKKDIIKVDILGLRLPTWVNIRGKVAVDRANLEGDFDRRIEVYDKKGNYADDELEEIKEEFEEKVFEMEEEGWKNIGSRIDVEPQTEMDIEVVRYKDIEY